MLGGGLGVYKMSKRVQGLSEWRIRQETKTVVQQQESTSRSSPSNTSIDRSGSTADTDNNATTAQESTDGDNSNKKLEENDKVNLHGLHAHVCVVCKCATL